MKFIFGSAISTVLVAGFTTAGCAAQRPRDGAVAAEVQHANQQAADESERVAALEARLRVLEQRAASDKSGSTSRDSQRVLDRLDRLVALNEELLMKSEQASRASEPSQPPPDATPGERNPVCDQGLNPEEQLRRLVERMHPRGGWRGGLSREESEALRVLLRRERVLDSSNPLEEW